jgi:hypothetical protein
VTADGGYCELLYDFTGSDNEGLGVFTGGYIATEDTTVTLEIIKDDGMFADLSSKIITDGGFHLIGGNPLAKGSTGIKITGNNGDVINVDEASIQLGSFSQVASSNCTDDLDCENEFSAKVSGAGAVSDENVDWIDSVALTDTSLFTISFKAGVFTSAPNCTVGVVNGGTSYDAIVKVSTQATTSQVQVRGAESSSTANFNKAEADTAQCINVIAVFIHASGHADSIGKGQPHDSNRFADSFTK